MATAVSPNPKTEHTSGVAPLRAGQGHEFLLRRLHSLSGIIPVGAFLFEHIVVSNAQAINGPTAYANQVRFLGSLPFVLALEIFGIWLPILFHAGYGFYIWYRGQSNLINYPWMGNWMYALQRWTGGIAFAYIIWHTYTMRFTGVDLHDHPGASFGKVQLELFNPAYFAFYVIGLLSASWHFAYGIWLFAAKWGITIGERARQRFLYVCMALFLLISGVGLASITSFRSHQQQPTDPAGAAVVEHSQVK
ncbi:MAG: Succinate dehydrogenase cytochrome b558 subunit [Candidatus Angelobacter sp.]|jgi:succinate dehydrogenase / fumarate reductase cytochrome b subunit|nr:Succinate dehydrogenase cytochrome b558 subunit [Candidatus Angelobacter sp.]